METQQTSDGPLVDAGACAMALGLPKATFYKMCKAGRIPTYKVGVKGRGLRVSITEARQALRGNGAAA